MSTPWRWLVAAGAWLCAACGPRAHEVHDDGGSQPAAEHTRDASTKPASASADGGSRDAGADAATAVPVDPIAVTFTEVGLEAGLDYVQSDEDPLLGCADLPPGKCWFSSVHMSGGAAAGDFDGDGQVDLYVTRLSHAGVLYRNRGDGTFEDVSEAAGLSADLGGNGAAFGDIDNDGDLDLYVTNVLRDSYALYVNDGGVFHERGAERGADVADDHRHHGFSPAFGDYDSDGFLDLHLTEWVQIPLADPAPSHARLLHNVGAANAGYFEDATDASGAGLLEGPRGTRTSYSSRFADVDGDGALDLLVVADFGTSRVFWNEGDNGFIDGTLFSGAGSDQNGMGAALGDYDGDGDLDWFITAIYDPDYRCDGVTCGWGTSGNRLFRNEGGRRFVDATDLAGVRDGGWGWGAEFFDVDNDGALDLVMANGVDFPNPEAERFRHDRTRLWRNRGDGSFDDVGAELGIDDEADGKGIVVFDYDGDGDQDVLIAQHAGRALLYRNDGGEKNAWLRVQLQGTRSNRNGLGAQLRLRRTPGERALLREISGGNGFLGQSEAIAHFGLGAWEGKLYELRVRWPDGHEQVLHDIAPRQVLVVREDLDR
jgi:hypothetical protein